MIRSSSIETQIRQATKEAVREIKLAGVGCSCRRPVAVEGCRNCLRREISNRLQLAGYNCAICKSKWRSSPDIPSGTITMLIPPQLSFTNHPHTTCTSQNNIATFLKFEPRKVFKIQNQLFKFTYTEKSITSEVVGLG